MRASAVIITFILSLAITWVFLNEWGLVKIPIYIVLGIVIVIIFSLGILMSKKDIEITQLKENLQRKEILINNAESYILKIEDKMKFEQEQMYKGLMKYVDNFGGEKWGSPDEVKEWKILELDLKNNFEKYSPFEFEELVSKLLNKMSYKTRLTSKTGDYGADIIAYKDEDTFVVQVKKYDEQNKVGAAEVQKLLGSMWKYNAQKAILITTSSFTNQAKAQATGAPIELWNKRKLHKSFLDYF